MCGIISIACNQLDFLHQILIYNIGGYMLQRLLCAIMVMAVCIGFVMPVAEARQDVYAYTYHGNNWYVDQDSIRNNTSDGLLHYTVYTMVGLRYDVASGSEYYNADVFYHDQKLSTESGQLLYKNPGILAANRMARQLQMAAPKTPVNSISADTSIGASANIGSVKPAGIKQLPASVVPPVVMQYTKDETKKMVGK